MTWFTKMSQRTWTLQKKINWWQINTHKKVCSKSIVTREMQIKTTAWYNYQSIRMAKIKQTKTFDNTKRYKKMWSNRNSWMVEMQNDITILENSLTTSYKVKCVCTILSNNPMPRYLTKKMYVYTKLYRLIW